MPHCQDLRGMQRARSDWENQGSDKEYKHRPSPNIESKSTHYTVPARWELNSSIETRFASGVGEPVAWFDRLVLSFVKL